MTNLEFYKEEIISKMYGGNSLNKVVSDLFWEHHYSEKADTSLKCILDWLCEEHSILDKEEKEYLSAVIRPFANRIVDIMKIKDWIDEDSNFEVLEIALKLPGENPDMEFVHLPYFDKDTMYKGMELNKAYTLEDLGLWLLVECVQSSS